MGKDDKMTVVAQCLVINQFDEVLTVRSFDKAWHTALSMPRPVHVTFDRFVRIDG